MKILHIEEYTENIPTVEIKDHNNMIDGKNFFDQPVKNNLRTYDNIKKIAIGQGDDYTTVCLLDYNYFNKYYKIMAIDLRRRLALAKAIQQINFTGNTNRGRNINNNTTMFFITEEAKKTILHFSLGTVKVL